MSLLTDRPDHVRGYLAAWARVSPAITLVPAFGLAALPAAARVGLALALAISIAPALVSLQVGAAPLWVELLVQAAHGLPVAIAASAVLWAATMAGGLADDLRGNRGAASLPNLDEGTTPLGALTTMLVAILFLEGGGAERVAAALMRPIPAHALLGVLSAIEGAIGLSIAVLAPVTAVSIVVELSSALIARAAAPAYVASLLSPLRSVAVLGAFALLFDRIVALLALAGATVP
ncbi:MAG TPA: flagellar biosynthetic protein FliR [Polyangiaceae bacterium]|jgi:type III secretory pathway component EscT